MKREPEYTITLEEALARYQPFIVEGTPKFTRQSHGKAYGTIDRMKGAKAAGTAREAHCSHKPWCRKG